MTPRRLVWILAMVLGTPVALYGLAWVYFVVPSTAADLTHRLAFDAKAWRRRSADAGHDWPTRLRMVDSLMDCRLLDGLTRAQVVELLGPADDTSKMARLGFRLPSGAGTENPDSNRLRVARHPVLLPPHGGQLPACRGLMANSH